MITSIKTKTHSGLYSSSILRISCIDGTIKSTEDSDLRMNCGAIRVLRPHRMILKVRVHVNTGGREDGYFVMIPTAVSRILTVVRGSKLCAFRILENNKHAPTIRCNSCMPKTHVLIYLISIGSSLFCGFYISRFYVNTSTRTA